MIESTCTFKPRPFLSWQQMCAPQRNGRA